LTAGALAVGREASGEGMWEERLESDYGYEGLEDACMRMIRVGALAEESVAMEEECLIRDDHAAEARRRVKGERLEWLAEQMDAEAARDVEAATTRNRVPILVRFANGDMEVLLPEDSPGSEEGSSEGVDTETDSDVLEAMYNAGVRDRPQSSQSSQS